MTDDKASTLEFIRAHDLFGGLDEEDLASMASLCCWQTYPAGAGIFAEGGAAVDFYIIVKGRVALEANFSARPGSQKQGTVEVLTENQILGWSAIAGSGPLTLGARAIEDTALLAINGAAFRRLLEQNPQMSTRVMQRVVAIAGSRVMRTKETLARILSIAAHDLRAPLNATQSYLSVLAGGFFGEVPDRQREVLERCNQRLSEFADIIDNILDMTRFEEGRLPMEELALASVVDETAEMLRPLAAKRGVSLQVHLPAASVRLQGSRIRIKQVVSNLLSNAIKFTPAGGEVEVRLAVEEGQARVVVADSGPGISAEDLPHIFDDFYQGQAAAEPGVEMRGVGLGLAICRKIVTAHRGKIWVKSPCPDSGQGSLFTFTLPRRATDGDERSQGTGTKEGEPGESYAR